MVDAFSTCKGLEKVCIVCVLIVNMQAIHDLNCHPSCRGCVCVCVTLLLPLEPLCGQRVATKTYMPGLNTSIYFLFMYGN